MAASKSGKSAAKAAKGAKAAKSTAKKATKRAFPAPKNVEVHETVEQAVAERED